MRYRFKPRHRARAASGLARSILNGLPVILLGGTLVSIVFSIIVRLFPPTGTFTDIVKFLTTADFPAIAAVVSVWTAMLMVITACCSVVLMKGRACDADAHPLVEPASQPSRGSV